MQNEPAKPSLLKRLMPWLPRETSSEMKPVAALEKRSHSETHLQPQTNDAPRPRASDSQGAGNIAPVPDPFGDTGRELKIEVPKNGKPNGQGVPMARPERELADNAINIFDNLFGSSPEPEPEPELDDASTEPAFEPSMLEQMIDRGPSPFDQSDSQTLRS